MKKYILYITIFTSLLYAQELKIKADAFNADEKKGVTKFEGHVNIVRSHDEINASKVIIYTNKKHKPTKFEAEGDVSFCITTKDKSIYTGKAQKVIYVPKTKEYYFYKDVYLRQLNEKKEIIGDEVVLKTVEGKAYAKGKKSGPIIMIFDIPESKEK
jgi:lipopolysaccharide export system protein LptA